MLSKRGDKQATPCGWDLNLVTARLTITWRLPRGGDGCLCTLGETTDTGTNMDVDTGTHHTTTHHIGDVCMCVYVYVCTCVRDYVSM